ncbi:sugar porter family MFS transporter [Robbsia sp. KACC 23696]|uniref:sugar porter family MFS transporter n=1 Tax=Robbsia sp. KACC 23696 TaxID=3149231 RepID=UPI00325AFB21
MNTITASAPQTSRARVIFTCVMAALAGLLFGLDIGVISGALPFIAKTFEISDKMQEWIVSSMMFGAAVGAVLASYLSWQLGRKYSLVLGAILFVVGSLICGFAWSPTALIGGRILLGLAVGIASFTAPLYLSEIAPQSVRGAMISLYQLMITVGILAAFISNTALSSTGNWRWMLGVIAFPAILLLLGVLVLPRSPRWLMMRGREQEAFEVLLQLRPDRETAQQEVNEIKEQLQVKQEGFSLLKANPNFRRSIALGILLQVMQQLTGINVVMYYAPRIFGLAGFSSAHDQLMGTVLVGAVNVAATFIAIGLVDRWGRKPILYTGFVVMAAGMGTLSLLLHMGVHTPAQQMTAAATLLIFIVGFAMSAGPLIWILCSEIQPTKGRDFGIGISTFTNWIANMAAGATFLTFINDFGAPATFAGYAVMNAIFIVLTIVLVPETKGVSLEHIERNLFAGKSLRSLGR